MLIWFVAAAWLLFGRPGEIELALAMVSVLAFIVIAIPLAQWRAGATRGSMSSGESPAAGATQETESWDSCRRGECTTSIDEEKSSEAVMEILLPIAAIAFGITVLGIVLDLIRAGVI